MNLVTFHNNVPSVSHRVIAEYTKMQEKSVTRIIQNHIADFEEFGRLTFQTHSLQTNGGKQEVRTYFLNEQQATLLLTYLKNVPIVRAFKKALVKEFYALREQSANDPMRLIAQTLETLVSQQTMMLQLLTQSINSFTERKIPLSKPPHYNTWLTPHEADMIVRLKRDGHSLAHIQRTLQRSDFVVRRVLKEAGMYTPPYRVVHVIEEA